MSLTRQSWIEYDAGAGLIDDLALSSRIHSILQPPLSSDGCPLLLKSTIQLELPHHSEALHFYKSKYRARGTISIEAYLVSCFPLFDERASATTVYRRQYHTGRAIYDNHTSPKRVIQVELRL